ncbi:MAG: VanW family protein [Candidatus Blackburnbacteria bacterium]|nr:VanW family protein [Candidatus Blackburnbacteria bacterium]
MISYAVFSSHLKNFLYAVKLCLIHVWRVTSRALVLLFLVVLFYSLIFLNRIYPGVVVGGVSLDGKTITQAQLALLAGVLTPEKIILKGPESQYEINKFVSYEIKLSDLGFSYDFKGTAEAAFSIGRKRDVLSNLVDKTALLWQMGRQGRQKMPLAYSIDHMALEEKVATISAELRVPAIEPIVSIKKKEVVLEEGKPGREVDTPELKTRIDSLLANNAKDDIVIPINEVPPKVSNKEAVLIQKTAKRLVGKNLYLKFEFDTISYPDAQLITLLSPKGGFDEGKIKELVSGIAVKINRQPQNAVFAFSGGRVQEFKPGKDGVEVKEDVLAIALLEKLIALLESEESITTNIPFAATPPEVSTSEVNNLGIKELLGRGASIFRGSISSRVYNIGLASSRISGTLVKPGETFSFNQVLGDVSAFTGYKQAYVISGGRTILGDGGGVCQVSTTLFRAALQAGLPIVERNQHSYRVGYYEQDSKPGIDATVYVPSIDFKFKNDTPGHLLIQRIFDPKAATLVFEIYGTSDGRVASVSTPRVWGVVPPPPTLYQDDPTLPLGVTKQVDFAAWGSKTAFDYKVTRGTEVLQNKTFYSNYRPWQAIYLRGTAPQ